MTGRRGKPPSQRQLRVAEEIRHVIASCLERGDLRDPALSGRGVTVTEVSISPDLRNAVVYVTPFPEKAGAGDAAANLNHDGILAGLNRAGPFLRRQVSKEMRLRFSPRLVFEFDDRFESAAVIDKLLRSPNVARDLEGGDGGVDKAESENEHG